MTVEDLIKKSKLQIANWILCLISLAELIMFTDIIRVLGSNEAVKVSLSPVYLVFLICVLILMIINGKRVADIRRGKFSIYKNYKGNKWVFEDAWFIVAMVPVETEFDEFLASKITDL